MTQTPIPLFDTIDFILGQRPSSSLSTQQQTDYLVSRAFLRAYEGSQGTFNSYRREVERLLHWTWSIAGKILAELKREDIELFIRFCQNPPKHWIGVKKVPRYVEQQGERIPNTQWRPFVATLSKSSHRQGNLPKTQDFELSQGALRETLAILGSFFNYLTQEEHTLLNPVALIRQKSKFIQKRQGPIKIRRLSQQQWQMVIQCAETMAEENPHLHERTLFMMSALYSMYLRISELSASARWIPKMNDFHRDHHNLWWFTTVGKGNKERQIAVSDTMLKALERWRQFLGLTPLPSLADQSPLLPKIRGKGPISNTTYIREIVQACFDRAIIQLRQLNLIDEADQLMEATVHWLRHTGISEDVKIRPREHVRDDAGHSSSAITDKYIDIELKERHKSARNKQIY